MKLVSFAVSGRSSWGVVTDAGVIDMGRRLGGKYPSLRPCCRRCLGRRRGGKNAARPAFAEIAAAADPRSRQDHLPRQQLPRPCAGGRQQDPRASPALHPPRQQPVGHEAPIIVPKISHELDYEVELAVVIGRGGRHIAKAHALEHCGGLYLLPRRLGARHPADALPRCRKNFLGTGPCGPWLVTRDEIADPGKLTLKTRLNGKELQNGNSSDLIFDIPTLIAYISGFTPLVARRHHLHRNAPGRGLHPQAADLAEARRCRGDRGRGDRQSAQSRGCRGGYQIMTAAGPLYLGVDIGGTFTDLVMVDSAGRISTSKALTTPASWRPACSTPSRWPPRPMAWRRTSFWNGSPSSAMARRRRPMP